MEIHHLLPLTREPHAADGPTGNLADRLAFDLEYALFAAPKTSAPIKWTTRGRSTSPVTSAEQLAVLASALGIGDFGVVEVRAGEHRWAQTMRVDDRWIVEVHDGNAHGWPSRVRRASSSAPDRDAQTEDWSSLGAAEVMWAWLHHELLEGARAVELRISGAGTSEQGVEWVTAVPVDEE